MTGSADPSPENSWTRHALAAIAISELEGRAYAALVDSHSLTRRGLAASLNVSPAQAGEVLASLRSKGLAIGSRHRAPRFTPTRPKAAISPLLLLREEEISRHQGELERARAAMAALDKTYLETAPRAPAHSHVEVLSGKEAVAMQRQLFEDTTQELLGMVTMPIAPIDPEWTTFKVGILKRGVTVRGLYEPDVLEAPGVLDFLDAVAEFGEETRIAPSLPARFFVLDRRTAVLPLQSGPGLVNELLFVHRCLLVDGLVALFERVWQEAMPFQFPAQAARVADPVRSPLSAEDQRVITMLAAGMRDIAIAQRLGLADRSAQRRVGRVMDLLHARTRFQAGWMAAQLAHRGDPHDSRADHSP